MTLCYFCNHPYPLVIFDTIAQIAKAGGLKVSHRLIFSRHRYFQDLDYRQFMQWFDRVEEIPYVETRRNYFTGLRDARRYVRALEAIRLEKNSIFFTISYSDLATNLFCSKVKRVNSGAELVHFTIYGNFLDVSAGKFSLAKTFRDSIYSLLLGARFMSTYVDHRGNVLEKLYWNDPHTKTFQLAFSSDQKTSAFPTIPFPLISVSDASAARVQKAVFFFGDGTLESYYSELDSKLIYKAINRTLRFLRERYAEDKTVRIFYKPHPLDRGRVPYEIQLDGIEIYQDRLTAEMILLQPGIEVLEVCSVSSTACLTASHFGIPSFAIFRLCGFPEYVVNRFAGHFETANPSSFVDVQSWEHLENLSLKKVPIDRGSIQKAWIRILQELIDSEDSLSRGKGN